MTSLHATQEPVSTIAADALVVGIDADGSVAAHPLLDETARLAVGHALAALDPSGASGKVTVVPGSGVSARRVVGVGLGDATPNVLREALGVAARSCGKRPASVVVAVPVPDDATAQAVAEGVILGAYEFTDYKSAQEPWEGTAWHIAGASDAAVNRASIVAAAVAGVRDLVNTPPLDMFPAALAEVAESLGARVGVDVRVWEAQQLADEGFGGIIAVGMGSSRLPRLVRVAWTPEGATQTVAIVGKGITFDTGGLSLKQPKGMETMKSDMSGAAVVLHTVLAAAQAKLPIAVTGWMCIAENMPSGTAQRPSDVIRIYGGTTVEVLNTDAEGRLVLADGLVRAIEENPDVVLDVATLTGAQGMALGTRTSGVMGSDDVRAEVVAAADAAGEPMWPMPMPAHLREGLDSKVADLSNMGDPAGGGMLTAAMFLREFVGDHPWAHLDIARPAFNEGAPHGSTASGATGASVRTLLTFLENRAGA